MDNETKENVYYIPQNFSTPGKWKSFYIVNILQGITVFALTWFFVSKIPRLRFVVKAGLIILLGGGLGALFVAGVNGRPLTQFLRDYISFIFRKKRYHFAKLEDIYAEANTDSPDSTGGFRCESKFDKFITRHKAGRGKGAGKA